MKKILAEREWCDMKYPISRVRLIQKYQDRENMRKSKKIQEISRDWQYRRDSYGF